MGLFKIRGDSVDTIEPHIWYPNLLKPVEWSRVMNSPGFKARYDEVLGHTDSIVEVFEVNKSVTAPDGGKVIVPASRPGIVARMSSTEYVAHIPTKEQAFDIASFAVRSVFLPDAETDPYKHGPHAGRMAVAMAIHEQVNDINATNNQ